MVARTETVAARTVTVAARTVTVAARTLTVACRVPAEAQPQGKAKSLDRRILSRIACGREPMSRGKRTHRALSRSAAGRGKHPGRRMRS